MNDFYWKWWLTFKYWMQGDTWENAKTYDQVIVGGFKR